MSSTSAARPITFLNVWIVLLVLTGVEVFLAYEQVPTLIMLTALLGLSVVKAAMIIAYFMHLKFEKLQPVSDAVSDADLVHPADAGLHAGLDARPVP